MPTAQLLFGPLLIGVLLNSILYGLLLSQMLVYYQAYQKDSAWIRYFVLYLLILETCNTAFDIVMIYEPLILNYGTQDALTFFPTMIIADPIVTVAISTPIQIFIACRIKIINGSIIVPVLICAFALVALAGGIWTSIAVSSIRVFARKQELHYPALTWLLASAITDAAVTASLVWGLYQKKTGFKDTDRKIDRIIRLTIQTGMITLIFAILDVAFFMFAPGTTLNFIWDLALGKLYSNALLSTLNARAGRSDANVANGANVDAHNYGNVLFGDADCLTNTTFRFMHPEEKAETNFQSVSTEAIVLNGGEDVSLHINEGGRKEEGIGHRASVLINPSACNSADCEREMMLRCIHGCRTQGMRLSLFDQHPMAEISPCPSSQVYLPMSLRSVRIWASFRMLLIKGWKAID